MLVSRMLPTKVLLILAVALALLAPAPLRADDATAAVDSTGTALAVESSAPPDVSLAESTAQAVGPVMEPLPMPSTESAQAATTVQPAKIESTASSEFPVTIGEVKTMLSKGQTPRLTVTNKYGGIVTGRAIEITDTKLSVDVSGENIGVNGVIGIPLANIVSMRTLVALSEQERAVAEKATAEDIAQIEAKIAPPSPSVESSAGAPAETPTAVESTAEVTVESTAQAGVESTAQETSEEGEKGLLAIYPPNEGWGPKKLSEIIRKSIVLHLHPFGKDQDFVNDYDAWKAAYEKKRKEQVDEMAQLQAAGSPIPPGFQVLPELPPVPSLESSAPSPSAESANQEAAPAATGASGQ